MKKTMILFCSLLLSISVFANNKEKEKVNVGEQYSIAESQIQNWQKEKRVDALSKICDSVQLLPQNADNKSTLKNKLTLIFSLSNLLDKNYTPKYETPYLNIAPPIETGLPSGIAPSAIKDEKLRKQYIKDLEKNKKIAENAIFQQQLKQVRDRWMEYMVEYISQNYKDEKQINKLIEDNVTNETTQKELKAKFDAQKKPRSK